MKEKVNEKKPKKSRKSVKETNNEKKQEKPKNKIKEITNETPKESIKENTKKYNKILLLIAIIIIAIIIIKVLSNNSKKIMINKSIDIEIGGYNQVATINYFIDNININDKKYIKVNIDIENKKDLDSNTSYHQFYLIDVNGNEVSPCYHGGMVNDIDYPNLFPNVIKASSHTKGNLYCLTDDRDIRQFKIKVISGGTIDANNKVNYEYSDYFVDLKK